MKGSPALHRHGVYAALEYAGGPLHNKVSRW